VVPRQLPAAVRHFTGRAAELSALGRLLDADTDTVVISAIGGMAGVGKTALAVHWARQQAERFPDGQLYANLRGFDPAGEPADPAAVIRVFLEALGIPAGQIPASPEAQGGLYRSLLAGRRLLIVLDNARDADQVRPLLPGGPQCLVLVTSRAELTGLAADGCGVLLTLGVLSEDEAREFLARRLGQGRTSAEPAALSELVSLCARLPLALAVTAARAAARPGFALAALAAELRDAAGRLDALDAGDAATSVRAVFSWSCRHLTRPAARMFALLGMHPGPDICVAAAASLAGARPAEARTTLAELTRVHLITEHAPGRYAFHDLLRAYARELAAACDSADERRAALTRLFDYYVHTAAAAMDSLGLADNSHPSGHSPQTLLYSALDGDPAAARDWLDAERANLVAVAQHTAAHGWPGQTTCLAATLFRYLDAGGYCPDAICMHTYARRAAQRIGDRPAEAEAVINPGVVEMRQGRIQQAEGNFSWALSLFRETGNRAGQARALGRLGLVRYQQGHYRQATGYHQQALALFRDTGNRTREAYTLSNLAAAALRQGRCQQAISQVRQALDLARQTGHRNGEGYALGNLAAAELRQGRCQQAISHLRQALDLARQSGHRTGEAYALTNLAAVELRQGRCQQAISHLQQALAVFRETTDRLGETEALNGLGEALRAAGQLDDARTHHAAALALASRTGDRYEQARAHHGLATTCRANCDPAQAHSHWQQALALYTAIGAPEAEQVHARLAPADSHPGRPV
jgi:tetratricopeptide (TPR) repeat protein